MAVVVCPKCKTKMDYHEEECATCGFQIAEYIQEQGLVDINKAMICPKCGMDYAGYGEDSDIIYLNCRICNTPIVPTDLTGSELTAYVCDGSVSDEETDRREAEVANKYGNNQFSWEAFELRLAKIKAENDACSKPKLVSQTPQVACPYCKSTNVKRISALNRAGSIIGFGILSNKIGKQWHCNSCNSNF